MMLSETIAELIQRGVQFRISDKQLIIRAPKGSLGDEEREILSSSKDEILSLLSTNSSGSISYFPLSHGQTALWFLHQLAPQSTAFNLTTAMQITSKIDIQVLRLSLQALIDRHPCLRTTYTAINTLPVQRVSEDKAVPLEEREISSLDHEALGACISQEADQPFDLEQGPIMRVVLFHLPEEKYLLQITVHHIAYDFWSAEIFIQELRKVYELKCNGMSDTLPPLSRQYPDWVRWQTELLDSPKGEELWDYWKNHLSGNLPALNLPMDRPRPRIQSFNGASYPFRLKQDTTQKLLEIAKHHGATPFMTMLAAFFALLYRYTGQEHLLIGSPTAGRSSAGYEGIIGFFVNPVVIRADISNNPSFVSLLAQVRKTVLGALRHADYPFPLIVQKLSPNRDLTQPPIFQVSFVWDKMRIRDNPDISLATPDLETGATNEKELKLEPVTGGQRGADCDLDLIVIEGEDGLSASWRYNVDLFDRSRIERMAEHFQMLLESIVANPEECLSKLHIMAAPEEKKIVVDFNDNKTEYQKALCVHQLIEKQAAQRPDAAAVKFNGEQLTYRELNARANKMAHYLRGKGVGPEKIVAIYMERSLDLITSILGVMKAGGAYLPLDPKYPPERLAFMLEDTHVHLILTHADMAENLPNQELDVVKLDTERQTLDQEDDANPVCEVNVENTVYVIFTSGSTGRAKGVVVKHGGLTNAYFAWEKAYRLGSLSSHLQMASFSFDVFTGDFVRTLCSGAKLVLCPVDSLMYPEELYKLMVQEKVDFAEFVPVVLRELMEYLEADQKRLEQLRILVCGSDSWYTKEYERFSRFLGTHTRLINSYGVSEATIDSTYFESVDGDLHPDQLVPIGRPYANMQIYILDKHHQPTPIGVPGELYIGGAGLAKGYLNRPELTQEKFIPNPLSDQSDERLYKTGDLARFLPDGNIELLGRSDFQVKIRGIRVEIGEIEAVLGQHPAVFQSAVKAVADEAQNKSLAAYVALNQPSAASAGDLREFLKEKLPDYMIPTAFVLLDELPLMPNGKVDRKALTKPEMQDEIDQQYVAPRSETEEKITAIWQEVLNRQMIGVKHDFFELGGHSLIAARVMSRLNQLFGIQLPLRKFFEVTTIEKCAELIDALNWTGDQNVGAMPTEEREIFEI